jgi:hypothetical protein
MFLASFLLQKTDITLKVAGILRQRYAECKAASKVFNNHLLKIALYGQCMSITSKMMYSVLGFVESPKDIGSVITPTSSILFPPKPYRVFVDSFNHLLSYPIFSKFDKKQDFGLAAIVHQDSSDVPSVYVHHDNHCICVWEGD